MAFINQHDNTTSASYSGLIEETLSNAYLAVGGMNGEGLFTKTDLSGNIDFNKKYTVSGLTISFSRGVEADNGDYIVYGSHTVSSSRRRNLVMRLSPTGAVIWAKTFHQAATRFNIRMVKSVNDTYFFVSWHETSGSQDDVEVIKINGSGIVQNAVNVGKATADDDQVFGAIPFGSGIIVHGSSSAGTGWDNFVIALNSNLSLNWKYLLGDSDFQQISSMVQLSATTFAIAGEHSSSRHSFIGLFDINATTNSAASYDFVPGVWDDAAKRLIKTSNAYYMKVSGSGGVGTVVAKFDLNFNMQWTKEFQLSNPHYLSDMIEVGNGDLLLAGRTTIGAQHIPLLIQTNGELDSCSTVTKSNPAKTNLTYTKKTWDTDVFLVNVTVTNLSVVVTDNPVTEGALCPEGVTIPLNQNPSFQSPYVYLQAAGSDASDDSVYGFHLRWDLMRNLGDTHLPKGNLSGPSGASYPTSLGFSRDDDFVRVYKTAFQEKYEVTVNFNTAPNTLVETGATREWTYTALLPNGGAANITTDVVVRFPDTQLYDFVRNSYNPSSNTIGFIRNYTGVVEVQPKDKLFFFADFNIAETGQSGEEFRLETVSIQDTLDPDSRLVTCREVRNSGNREEIICENIEYLRFDYDVTFPNSIRIITYEDYISNHNSPGDWDLLGNYALDDGLSDNSAAVYDRLEDTSKFTIDGTWRKYNEPDVNATGEFRVSVQNYKDRWDLTEGLKDAVATYLQTSQTDVTATVTHTNDDDVDNDSEMDVSYLEILNFVSLDFHVARMLGLGTIDADSAAKQGDRYLYLMEYVTEAQLDDSNPAALTTHFYMTPPLGITDYRTPEAPVQKDVTYGIYADNKTGNPTLLTDPQGYSEFFPSRYINLHREPFRYEFPMESFFQTSTQFCICDSSATAFLGLEYANGTIATGNPFVRPEIINTEDFTDPGGLFEVSPIPNGGNDPLYIHEETTTGYHHYGLYSINWFSRVSDVGNLKETDNTQFVAGNNLLPPSNFAVQLIQPETPLLFTTSQEQSDLAAITTTDKTYVRLTFDWDEIHNQAHQSATAIQFFWNEEEPLVVQGEIASGAGAVVVNSTNHTVDVQTTGYLNASINQNVVPEVVSGTQNRFVGARLSTGGRDYEILSVLTTGVNPSFRLRQIRVTQSMDINNDGTYCTTEIYESPSEGDRFLTTENLDSTSSWDEQLAGEVVMNSLSTHSETVTYDDGTTQTFEIGGLIGGGDIVDVADPDPNILSFVPSGGPSQVPTGVYTITYSSALLPAYTNSDPDIIVDYVGGTVRVHDINGAVKKLMVWKIDTVGGATELTAFDPTFGLQRDANNDFILTGSDFTPVPGYVPIDLGTVPFINFHPSYRCYVYKGTTMDETTTLPAQGAGNKKTYLAARSIDHSDSTNLRESFMTTPSVMMAQEIITPVPPGIPTGPLFATRPNFYGKATYTFDVQVDNPFSLIFFRASEQTLLDTLYKEATRDQILTDLENLVSPDADFFQDRWSDLVNTVIDSGTNTFPEYTTGGYRFPMPDNDKYLLPHGDPNVLEYPFASSFNFSQSFTYTDPLLGSVTVPYLEVVKDAIDGSFLPLTESPALYKALQDTDFQTSGKKPVVRDPQTGERYTTADSEYDEWPMAFRYEKNGSTILQYPNTGYGNAGNTRFVRFTDYTLDGSARNFYFYFGVELASNLAVSDRSPIKGPIQLIDSAPAKAPAVKKVVSINESLMNGTPAMIRFEMNPYVEADNIRKFRIYRAINAQDALSVRTMSLSKTVNVGEDVVDDFEDQLFPLFGETLFYRIVAMREIENEQGQMELIPSEPSNLGMTNLIDVVHPDAPTLTYTSDAPSGSPLQLTNVNITFNATAYNATYFVYKQNSGGNWVMIREIDPSMHNNVNVIPVELNLSSLASTTLVKQDADLKPIYHRFRVDVENSSGMPNVNRRELTI